MKHLNGGWVHSKHMIMLVVVSESAALNIWFICNRCSLNVLWNKSNIQKVGKMIPRLLTEDKNPIWLQESIVGRGTCTPWLGGRGVGRSIVSISHRVPKICSSDLTCT